MNYAKSYIDTYREYASAAQKAVKRSLQTILTGAEKALRSAPASLFCTRYQHNGLMKMYARLR